MLDGAPLNSHRNGVYRYYWFRVHWGRGSGSPQNASRPSAVGNRLAVRIAIGPAHRSPALRILDAVHGVDPAAAYARVS